MCEAVIFTLWAPLAAMGDIAVGERRGGILPARPLRGARPPPRGSGSIGAYEAAHAALDREYLMAQRLLHRGELLQDYHTVQAPPADRKAQRSTRRAALDQPAHTLGTLLSLRDYRLSPFVDVALVPRRGSGATLRSRPDRRGLRRPAFVLYLGRKACPLVFRRRPR